MAEAYVKRLRVTESVSTLGGMLGPYDIVGDDPTDMCVWAQVEEYYDWPLDGCGGSIWRELAPNGWYPTIARATIDPWYMPVADTVDFTLAAMFQPVDLRLPPEEEPEPEE